MNRIFRIGTRGSRLALAQAKEISRLLKKKFPKHRFRLVIVKTAGDEFQTVELFKKNNTGVFTNAIEQKLLNNEIDIAVHSLKDLPTEIPEKLLLAAYPKRLDTSDVLISRKRYSLSTLPKGALVGTGSPRRKRQLNLLRPDLKVTDLRGNLDTRIKKVIREKKYDAVVVACAGLLRLKKYLKYSRVISNKKLLPAVGQAALGLEIRKNDSETCKLVSKLNHKPTEQRVVLERVFLSALGGGCRVPVGVSSWFSQNKIHLKATVFSTTSSSSLSGDISSSLNNSRQAGRSLAKKLLKMGAKKFLKEARNA